jgi:hypothetical protein
MKKGIIIGVKILLFIGVFCIFGCDLWINNDGDFYFDEKNFLSEWDAWNNQNINNYSFVLKGELPYWNYPRAILMFDYEVKIIVKNGIMDSFEYFSRVPHDAEDVESILEPEFTSISDMYQKIYDRAQDEKIWWNGYSGNGHIISTTYDVKYNENLHYISAFEPISKWKPDVIVDTTAHAVSISDFVVLDID